MPLGLGIDLGTTNTKVVLAELGAAAPRVRAAASAPTPEPGDLRATPCTPCSDASWTDPRRRTRWGSPRWPRPASRSATTTRR
ncbi:MAG TPA: hypothetical protein VFW27_28080 [Actinoplanes sp.]|jgi:molecular chaperone DnaK (HSP70)|nr:hypothetical protein [Actinoplanes sp.]